MAARVQFWCLATLVSLGAVSLLPAQVDISADEPIVFADESGALTARGNVVVQQNGTRLQADTLTVDPLRQRLEARGNLRFIRQGEAPEGSNWDSFWLEGLYLPGTQGTLLVEAEHLIYDWGQREARLVGPFILTAADARLVAPRLEYDLEARAVRSGPFRLGNGFVLIEGDDFLGTPTLISSPETRIYSREPGPWSLSFRAREVSFSENSEVRLRHATAWLGPIPFFYFPSLSSDLQRPPIGGYARVGFRNRLGTFIRVSPLVEINPVISVGGSFEAYSRRGMMLGPRLRYTFTDPDNWKGRGSFDAGFISDRGPLENDILGRTVPRERYYLDWKQTLAWRDRLQMIARIDGWSDSEVTRDFRPERFEVDQFPRAFFETVYRFPHSAFHLTGNFRVNSFQTTIERLPEIGYELYLQPLPGMMEDWLQEGFFRFALLQRTTPFPDERIRRERIDGYYGLRRSYHFAPWLNGQTVLGSRLLIWPGEEGEPLRLIGDIGFDLKGSGYGDWDWEGTTWPWSGIRHLVQPLVKVRLRPQVRSGDIPPLPIEDRLFIAGLPSPDLRDDLAADFPATEHLLRVGLENTFTSLGGRNPGRTVARIDLYQDILFRTLEESPEDSVYLRGQFSPANWISLVGRARFSTEDGRVEETFLSLSLIDQEFWTVRVAYERVRDLAEQYRLEGLYRWRERYVFSGLLNYDNDIQRINERRLALRFPVVNGLDARAAVISRSGITRDSEFQITFEIIPLLF